MRRCRIHQVNSRIARFSILLESERILKTFLLIAALGSVELACSQSQAQEGRNLRVPSIPNPFRSGQSTQFSKTTADSFGTANKSGFANVIQLERLPSHNEPPVVTAISVSPSGAFLAAAGDDHAIRIVELNSGKTLSVLVGHVDWVQCVEFSPSGQRLASCGNDGTLLLWDLSATPKLLSETSAGHALSTLAFLGEDQIFVAGFGNNIYRWSASNSKLVVDHSCECSDIRAIACSPDRSSIAYGGRDGVLRVLRFDTPNAPVANDSAHGHTTNEIIAPLHFDRIRSLQFSEDGKQITSVGEDRRIVHFDLASRKAIGKTEIGGGKLMGLCQLEPHLFALAGSDNSIRIFSDLDQRVLVKLIGHDGSVSVLKKTSKYIISGSFDTTIRVWDIDQAISSTDQQGRYVHPVAAQFEDSGAGDSVK
jgi:WD40 repeat protein